MSAPLAPGTHLLVLSLDTYGDVLLRQPLLTRLLDQGHRVTLAVRRGYEDIVPFLDPRLELAVSDVNRGAPHEEGHLERMEALRLDLTARAPDVVVCAPFNRNELDAFLLGEFPGTRRVGFRAHEGALDGDLLTDAVDMAEEAPETAKNAALLEALAVGPAPLPPPRLRIGDSEHDEARRLLAELGMAPNAFVVGCPAGTVTTALKAWPAEEYAGVVTYLHERHGLPVLLVGVAAEEPHLRRIAALAEERGPSARVWLGGPGRLGSLFGLLAASRLYVGSDSGPMHFAAALDVPVVARFGGGHWPRFLPEARRGFIATQGLPCFGCGWDCWLPEPSCIRSVSAATIQRGIDQVLADGADGRTVDMGASLDPATADLMERGAAVHRQLARERTRAAALSQRIVHLEGTLRFSEADRAARLDIINETTARLARREADVNELTARLASSEADRAARLAVIQQMSRQLGEQQARLDVLGRDVRYLSTVSGALRVVGGAGLRTIGLYDVAYRHRRGLNRLLAPFSRPPGGEPSTVGAATATSPSAPMPPPPRPTLLEAFVEARSLPGDASDLALERLHLLGTTARRALCLGGSPRTLQCAFMLASGGAEVTLPGTSLHPRLAIPGLLADERDLGAWMAATGRTSLVDFDTLLLDASCGEDEKRLLNARIARAATILATGRNAGEGETVEADGLVRLSSAPPAWIDPAPALPERLPSGRPWPRITVVTVSFNHAAFLEETILSVLNQGYPDLEYIVVDGGSTDGTAAILDRYRDRLAWCVSEKDRGQSDALNKGFARATGQVLAWLNSDDRYPAGALWRAALALDTWEADVVAGGCGLVQDDAREVVRVHHSALPVGRRVPLPLERLLDLDGSWIPGDFFYQPEVFWTRDIWERSGARVAEELYYSMDYELWARFAAQGARIVHVPDLLAVYRMHAAQKTSGAELPYLPELRKVAARLKASLAGASPR